jgi:hypothetical protein
MRVHINPQRRIRAGRLVGAGPSLLAGVARTTARVDWHFVNILKYSNTLGLQDKIVSYINQGKLPPSNWVEMAFTNRGSMTQ